MFLLFFSGLNSMFTYFFRVSHFHFDCSFPYVATSVKAGNRKSGGIIHCFFLVKSCQLEVRGFDIKTEF